MLTKRNVASIYDQFGIISPSHVLRKVIYRELCDNKISWDAEVSKGRKTKFEKWANDVSSIKTKVPTSILLKKESVTSIDLHVFGDTSAMANCSVIYALIY